MASPSGHANHPAMRSEGSGTIEGGHTPGPWIFEDHHPMIFSNVVPGEISLHICTLDCRPCHGLRERQKSDGRLIAAAPAMFTVLLKLRDWVTAATHQDRDGGSYLNGDSDTYPGDAWDDLEKIDAEVRAAIAQATLPAAHGALSVQANEREANPKGKP